MKNYIILSVLFLFSSVVYSQPPQAINYQGVARDAVGHPFLNKTISVRLSVLDNSPNGTTVYSEKHSVTTSPSGLFNVLIGTGTVVSGVFSTIPWVSGDKFLKVEVDTSGGNSYVLLGTTQFMSVPYALHSGTSKNSWNINGNTGIDTSNFIGTKDNVPFYFRVNNQKAGIIDPVYGNTSIGYQSLYLNAAGGNNIAIGFQALYSNTTGSGNTANGYQSLYYNKKGNFNTATGQTSLFSNDSGSYNTANGISALWSNTSGNSNTSAGYQSLFSNTTGSYNTATGQTTLFSNIDGSYNTANGISALWSNTSGNSNTSSGYQSLFYNTTGSSNTATGQTALFSNSTGYGNTANGVSALWTNSTGYYNTAIGEGALYFNTTSDNNTAIGYGSLMRNNIGYQNSGIGSQALVYNTSGYYNTAVGQSTLYTNTTGSKNTAIGYAADVAATDLIDATAIGANAVTNANDKIVIGTSSNNNLTGGYGAWQSFSDGRFKYNVQANVPGLSFITKLHPVTYNLNAEMIDEFLGIKHRMDSCKNPQEKERYFKKLKEISSHLQTGFIAQEVETAARSIGYDFDGVHHPESDIDNYTIGYSTFVVPLIKAVQEQQLAIEELKKSTDMLKDQIEKLRLENSILNNTK